MNIKILKKIYIDLFKKKKILFNRSLSFGDYFTDRWERAVNEGVGEGSSVYDNVIIIGNVKVGKNTWIGPNCILDGSGGLEIGDNCTISAGVHIYTHNSLYRTLDPKKKIKYKKTIIHNDVYVGPNAVITMGVTIYSKAIVGALSFVDKNIKSKKKYVRNL